MPRLNYSLRNNFDQLNDVVFNNVLLITNTEMRDTN